MPFVFPTLAVVARDVPLWWTVPFGLLLLLIAVMPLTPPGLHRWWEKYYPLIALALATVVGGFYSATLPGGGDAVGHALREYASFIALIGSLFVVAGGIHLKVKGEATPLGNVIFLAVG